MTRAHFAELCPAFGAYRLGEIKCPTSRRLLGSGVWCRLRVSLQRARATSARETSYPYRHCSREVGDFIRPTRNVCATLPKGMQHASAIRIGYVQCQAVWTCNTPGGPIAVAGLSPAAGGYSQKRADFGPLFFGGAPRRAPSLNSHSKALFFLVLVAFGKTLCF
jgi:hypothetical protein